METKPDNDVQLNGTFAESILSNATNILHGHVPTKEEIEAEKDKKAQIIKSKETVTK